MYKSKDFITAAVLAIVLSFVLFGNGIGGDFVFDDKFVIIGNPLIDSGFPDLWRIFSNPYHAFQPRSGLFRPLPIASYAFNWFIFGNSPVSFHVVNILLHAFASFLVFLVAYKLIGKRVAFLSMLLFLFLPIHVESITSIVGRAEILAFIFFTLALYFVLIEKYALAAGSFFFGLLSKETAIALVPTVLFLEVFLKKKKAKVILKNLLYFVPVLALYGLMRFAALGKYFLSNDATTVYNPIKFAPSLSGFWTSFKVFYLYLEKTFWPLPFSSDYSFNQIPLITNPFSSFQSLAGMAIFAFLVWILIKKKNNAIGLAVAVFLFSYFIISNWVFKIGTIMGERLFYLPSFGLILIIGMVVDVWLLKIKNAKLFLIPLVVVLTLYGGIIIQRNKAWLNEQNLFASAYASAPNSAVNMTNMAYLSYIKKDYQDSQKHLEDVLAIAPNHVPTLNLIGQVYKKLGEYQKAEESWKRAIELRDDYLRAYLSLGILYYESGYPKSAEYILTKAVEIYPRWNEIFVLSLTKINLGKYDEAVDVIKKQFGDNPERRELKFAIGLAYYRKGDRGLADFYLSQAKSPQITMEKFMETLDRSSIFKIETQTY